MLLSHSNLYFVGAKTMSVYAITQHLKALTWVSDDLDYLCSADTFSPNSANRVNLANFFAIHMYVFSF